jgi:ferritin-like metal-binding protein YciE
VVELDGTWVVERESGALPPMVGVRKRIADGRGVTTVASRVELPFDVRGLSLHYRFPRGLVDHLQPEAGFYRGRATLFGRELGRFVMRRIDSTQEDGMAEQTITDQLVKHIDEGLAMEQNVLRMLDGMVNTTDDAEIKEALRQHKLETERHADRLRERLQAHGASPSVVREAGGIVGALMKSVADLARTEKTGRNARDAYATEHMEIASYQLLERVATRAGDEETARIARENRADEERMAQTIDASWDRFADLSLKESGVTV